MSQAVVAAALLCGLPVSAGAATVRAARVAIVFSPGACDVTSHLAIDTSEPAIVDHRLMLGEARRPPEFVVLGAVAGQADTIGRTASLRVSLTGAGRNEYTVRYRIVSPGERLDRCPLLVPSAPADGLSRAVTIDVGVPPGATRLPGEFPAFDWENDRGRATLGHMPSFVRVPLSPAGSYVSPLDALDLRGAIDVAAVAVIGVATLAWVTLRKRRA